MKTITGEPITTIYVPEVNGKNTKELLQKEGDIKIRIHGRYILIAKRARDMLHWCGYLSLPEEHPWHNCNYDNIPVNCHGGPTFAGRNIAGLDKFFVGFDCAHSGDISPGNTGGWTDGIYRTIEYVMEQLEDMYGQAVFELEESKVNK
tara:strand:- start:1582 stop:2025 length:444 start_codon:yes stop_codon:yes gene_type:complete